MTKFSEVSFRKSHGILDQFDKSIKSYIKMFEAAGLLCPPPPLPRQVGLNKTMICHNSIEKYVTFFQELCQYTGSRNSCPEVFCRKSVLRNFAKFTGKRLCQRLFFNKVAGRQTDSNNSSAVVLLCH